jgi:hypothetical protein
MSTSAKTPEFTPVVAIDVDGVWRISPRYALDLLTREALPEYEPLYTTFQQQEYPKLFHSSPYWDENGEARSRDYFSKVATAFLQEVAKDPAVEAVWATTWQRWANHYFGQALGVPKLPVAVKTLEPEHLNWFRDSPDWKAHQLATQFPGRPLIWLDDNMPVRDRLEDLRAEDDRALTLSYRVDPTVGLTAEDIARIRGWLSLASTPEGQATLRKKRADELALLRASAAERTRKRAQERAMEDKVYTSALELFPGQEYFAREVGAAGGSPQGLTSRTIYYALKRHSLTGDPGTLSAKLRVPGYHREEALEDPDDPADF